MNKIVAAGVLALSFAVPSLASASDATLLMGSVSSGSFVYNSTKPVYTDQGECIDVYGSCGGVEACGFSTYYPDYAALVKGYMAQNSMNAIKIVTDYGNSCFVTN